MRVTCVCVILLATLLASGCASRQKLKTPCDLPASALSFGPVDDCGPLLPVNQALTNIIVQQPL